MNPASDLPRSKALILVRAKAQRAEIKQLFLDVDHWNRTHPGEEPLEADPRGDLARLLEWLEKLIAEA